MAGLYVHIPFCAKRCVYCDFYFVTTGYLYEPFTNALCLEIEHQGKRYGKAEPIRTIYFGGGTPSLMPIDQLARILNALAQWFDLSQLEECTLEVNPDDLSLTRLRAWESLGINRLSIGIQSFRDEDLQLMGRAHRAEQALKSIPLVRKAGFDNFSIDLIFGIPGQSMSDWIEMLNQAIDLDVPHISAYGLTVEEGTVLNRQVKRGLITPTSEDSMSVLLGFTMMHLQNSGYRHYEISNYAKPGYEAIHNQLYWAHKNYLGFGPSAHSFWWNHPPSPDVKRWSNVRNLRHYQKMLLDDYQLPIQDEERLTRLDLVNEYIFLRLRTEDGIDLEHLEEQYGVDLLLEKLDDIAWLEESHYIHPIRKHRIQLTDGGKILCDSVTQRFLYDSL